MNTRRVVYCLICAVILYSASVAASQYADYSHRPLSEMFEVYSRFETNFQAGSNYNVGAAAALVAAIGKKGGREVLPFLKEKSFDPETHEHIRSAAARAYVKIADVEESIVFMRKAFGINDDKGFWRSRITPLFLEKMESAIANRSVSDETEERLFAYDCSEADSAGDALMLVLTFSQDTPTASNGAHWSGTLTGNEVRCFNPIKAHFGKIPPKQRIDLRKRFSRSSPKAESLSLSSQGCAVVAAWLVLQAHEAAYPAWASPE